MNQPDAGCYYVGVDVGGTNTKIGVVADDGSFRSHVKIKTRAERPVETCLEDIYAALEDAVTQSGVGFDAITAIGLATPGTMDLPAGLLLDPPNLPTWSNLPIREIFAERFDKPTTLQNDANAAAYGEYWVGAGRDARSMLLWTLGTGIGCGIIVDHRIIEGEHSHGSESGHQIIQMEGGRLLAGTRQYGTLEAYAGAKAIVKRTKEALDAGCESLLHEWLERGEPLTPRLLAAAAEEGDFLADEVIMETARYLGVGTVTVMHTINPGMVLFGGAMTFGGRESVLGRRFLQRIRLEIQERAFPVPAARTLVDFATLGGHAGLIGAAGCARLKHGPASP